MKNRVNLYHPEFQPKLRLLTLTIVVISWLLVTLFCGLFYVYEGSKQQHIKSELAQIEQQKQQQKVLAEELQRAVDNQKVDPLLLKQVQQDQQLNNRKKRVLDRLSGLEDLKSKGFSNLMIDLARHKQAGLWLTHINLNGNNVVIKGAATDPAIVPKWVSSLGKTNYFKGQEFAGTRLYRDPQQQLNFIISTSNEFSIEEAAINE